ncbi:PriCT-2 domain-containing protein [Gammaproteobacteria bacterium]|nr:PriCT-2 domain-containing protein [Gammaproteobacteria bacterium]MDC1511783.1 PriCT-2 domain-containing protein [Gammaproteobacteria bacterium]
MNSNNHEMWQLFDEHAGVLELRGIKQGLPTRTKTISWQAFPEEVSLQPMFDNFTNTALEWDAAGYNVYAVLNDIDEHFSGSSVKNGDISGRNYLFIDIDRAEKADCPASEEEVQHAIDLSNKIRRFMAAQGWVKPLAVMSGNGVHLYFYLNGMPNTPELTEKIRALLQSLGDKFDNGHVKVDPGVYNASRITKVIGTTAKKGIESPGRPYRKVRILSAAGSYGLRVPCFNSLLDKTLNALGFVKERAARPITKLATNSESALLKCSKPAPLTPREIAILKDQLTYIDPNCDYETWRNVVFAILSTGLSDAEDIARAWSEGSPEKFDESAFYTLINSYIEGRAGLDGSITRGTIYHHARAGGWNG